MNSAGQIGTPEPPQFMANIGRQFVGECRYYKLSLLVVAGIVVLIGAVCLFTATSSCEENSFACQVTDLRNSAACMTDYLMGGSSQDCPVSRYRQPPPVVVPIRPMRDSEAPAQAPAQGQPTSNVTAMRQQAAQNGYAFM